MSPLSHTLCYIWHPLLSLRPTLAGFRISQHVLLKEFFISTTAFLPASLSVYLLYI